MSNATNIETRQTVSSQWTTRAAILDNALLGVIVLLSVALYVGKLGFYSDDWAFLSLFIESKDQSLWGIFYSAFLEGKEAYSLVPVRPGQIGFLAILYKLFGLHPFGYHLVNSLLLCACAIQFYWVLRELRQPRAVAFSMPLIWVLMPHYSTNRFWYSAASIGLSQSFYFLSLLADLKSLTVSTRVFWLLRLISLLAIILSAISYEVTLPLFFLNLAVVLYAERKLPFVSDGRQFNRVKRLVLIGSNLIVLIGLFAYKFLGTVQAEIYTQSANRFGEIVKHLFERRYIEYGLNLKEVAKINFWYYGVDLPRLLWRMIANYPDVATLIGGFLVLGFVFGVIYLLDRRSGTIPTKARYWLRMMALGIVVTGFGYAVFLATAKINLTPTGIGNRVNMAAAIGIAMTALGFIGLLSTRLPSERLRRYGFCALVALLCSGYFVLVNLLAGFWINAYQEEQVILQEIQQQLPELPDNTVILLDGLCSYNGPAIVFESSWDLAGALRIHYHKPSIRADVVNENTVVGDTAMQTSLYGWMKESYPYGENLLMFNFNEKAVFRLKDAATAHQYFVTHADIPNRCPTGTPGFGVRLF